MFTAFHKIYKLHLFPQDGVLQYAVITLSTFHYLQVLNVASYHNAVLGRLRSEDDVDLIRGTEEQLQEIKTKLVNKDRAYGMQMSADREELGQGEQRPRGER